MLSTGERLGADYHALVAAVAYLTMPIVGQVLWAGWNRRIPRWLAGIYLLVAWAQCVWAGNLRIDPDRPLFPLALVLAFVLFLLGLVAEPYLRGHWLWRALAARTLPLFLLQAAVLFPVLGALDDRIPLWLALLIGLLALATAVELCYRLVERPAERLRHALRPVPRSRISGSGARPGRRSGR